jgi:hypothetical protein
MGDPHDQNTPGSRKEPIRAHQQGNQAARFSSSGWEQHHRDGMANERRCHHEGCLLGAPGRWVLKASGAAVKPEMAAQLDAIESRLLAERAP